MKKQKSYYAKIADVERKWYIVDAKDKVLGRIASKIASIVRGKEKATYTPSVDVGDYVIVVNTDHVKVTGNKKQGKIYHKHSGYPGGLKKINFEALMRKNSCEVLYKAVWGMLPHNSLGRTMMKKVKIYSGDKHSHEAQNPISLDISVKEAVG
ncbi:MAG: 50S ribosomal protein L13 [bacterium]|nr:50S ribosomal protein L13 [bacterium]